MIYAGIGSRKTPNNVINVMVSIGKYMASLGYVLRSGAAAGADAAFERGCDTVGGAKDIFLPLKGFNGSQSSLYPPTPKAMAMARDFHPAWDKLSSTGQLLWLVIAIKFWDWNWILQPTLLYAGLKMG
jgi:hypothetical protein